ncbi:MAG: outer membrane beta-barrel protein [Candidatus Latescibacterota bacterium]
MRHWNLVLTGATLVVACLTAAPASADLSAFIAAVSFDDQANLESAPGVGLRWGKSSGVLGGETSLMISRPDREVGAASESATAIFYEGRILLNIPAGQIKPFVGVGFGRITIFPGTLSSSEEGDSIGATAATLDALSQTESNTTVSYGAGVRYALNDRIDARFDLRQYQVFSVTGALKDAAIEELAGEEVSDLLSETEENTVTYGEMSVGVVFRF